MMTQIPRSEIKAMKVLLRVKGIGSGTHLAMDYVHLSFYFPGTIDKGQPVLAEIKREIHLVDDLKAKMLIENDILIPEGFLIDLTKREAIISSCKTTIQISTKPKGSFVAKRLRAAKDTVVDPWSNAPIEVNLTIPTDRDFIFEQSPHATVSLYYHVVDAATRKIFAQNDSPHEARIPKRFNLSLVFEIQYGNCFQVTDCSLAMRPLAVQQGWKIVVAAAALAMTSLVAPASLPQTLMSPMVEVKMAEPMIPRLPHGIKVVKPVISTGAHEQELPNGIKIYDTQSERQIYTKLVNEFPTLWNDDGFIKVPPDEWMRIPLKEGWQDKLTGRSKIYPLGIEDRKLVDETFDKMHEQGRLKWTDEETPFSFPVFVVWKMSNGKRKGRAVVDIRGLNEMIVPDAYPVPSQDEIINDLRGCKHLLVLDAMSFFYQWRVHDTDTFKLTVVTHRGQETFLVPVMGCGNSIAYVQRRMDRLLHEWRAFVKVYIDDLIVRSKTFEDHIIHSSKSVHLVHSKQYQYQTFKDVLGLYRNQFTWSASQRRRTAQCRVKA